MNRDARDEKRIASAGRAVAAALRGDRPLRRFLLAVAGAAAGSGGSAFLAGGYLRDVVDGKPASDVDVMVAGMSRDALAETLDALPRARLGIRKVVAAGRQFPVFRVATRWSDRYVDISTARGGGDSIGWAPFSRALADAARRDFTINSLLYELLPKGNRLSGELIDAFGGIGDLKGRAIRCVGSPEARLREDPVRALRAIRMKNERRGYRIEPATWRAIRRFAPSLLPGVAADRLPGELLRSLQADPAGTLDDLSRSGILRALLPELVRRRSGAIRARRRYVSAARSPRAQLPPTLLLANLLLDLPPGETEAAARRLRFPNVRRILAAVSELRALRRPGAMRFPLAETEAILARQEAPGPFIALHRASEACDGVRGKDLKRFMNYCAITPVFIDGNDLKRMGFPKGPGMEGALLAIREATLGGRVKNRDAAPESVRGPGSRPRAGA